MKAARLLSLLFAVAAAKAQIYHVTYLGTLGGSWASAYGINAAGQVVGQSILTGGLYDHAFLYSDGSMQDLGTLGGSQSVASAINQSGQIVGSADLGGGTTHAFLYANGSMGDLGTLGGSNSYAAGIDSAGRAVGTANAAGGLDRAFLYSGGSMLDLGTLGGSTSGACGINDSGQIAGTSDTAGDMDSHAFLYSGGSMQDLGTLGGRFSTARGINASGQVVGESYIDIQSDSVHAFLYSGGAMHDLGALQGSDSAIAFGINAVGQIVGRSYNSAQGGSNYRAFLYSGGAMRDLNSMLDSSGAYVTLDNAQGINDRGQIIASDANGLSYLLTPYFVDDPAAYTIVKGLYVSGSLSSLFSIDGSYLVARTNAARQRSAVGVTITLDGTSSVSNPSDLRLLLTGHVNSTNLGQKVEMYDYVANAWVVVDSTTSTQSDSTETAIATNPGRFVQTGTNAMRARISWNPTGIASLFPWSVSIDQAVWNASP